VAYRRLPAVPSVENLKNQAKSLLSAYRHGEEGAVADFDEFHPRRATAAAAHLTDAQLVLARSYRQASWQRLITMARVQRALHDDDVATLQQIVGEHPAALSEFLSARESGPSTRSGFSETTQVKYRNVRSFLRTFAPDIALDELQIVSGRHGDSIVCRYGDDKVVKVPKNGTRIGLVKEARLYEYLGEHSLSVSFPEPLFVHERGLYAVYSRIPVAPLTVEALRVLTPTQLENAVHAIARFFRLLHTHHYPDEILELVPKGDAPYDVQLDRMRRKIQFIAQHDAPYDTSGWTAQLDRLEGALQQRWKVIHCDPSLSHFYALDGDCERLAVTHFTDALLQDPAIDLADFLADRELQEDVALAGRVKELLLTHYETDDADIAEKVEFGMLDSVVRWAHIDVRAGLKASEA
jgi:hypothetical protein